MLINKQFRVYVQHPFGSFGNPHCEFQSDDLDSAIDSAFQRIAEIVPNTRVWIETETGQILPLMN